MKVEEIDIQASMSLVPALPLSREEHGTAGFGKASLRQKYQCKTALHM
jgi:hypothetical protein